MRFPFIEVEDGTVTCTVCGRELDGSDSSSYFYYVPVGAEEWQLDQIAEIWQIDPFTEFAVCENCLGGHCGVVPGLTPDGWLGKQWAAHLNRRKAAE